MDAAEYAVLRQALEAGRVLHEDYQKTGRVRPEAEAYLRQLEGAIPAAVLSAGVKIGWSVPDDVEPPPAQFATLVFSEYEALRAALDAAAGPTYGELVAAAPGAAGGDVEWWAVAVSAAGALWWLGRLSWRGALVAQLLAAVFAALAAYEALTIKTEDGKNLWRQVGGEALGWVWWVAYGAAGLALVGGAVFVATYARGAADDRRQRRRALQVTE